MNPIFDKVPRFASPAAAGRPADAAPPRVRTASRLAALGLAAMLPLGAFGVARAEDPPHGGGDVQAKIEEKMKEILRLMRENGKMILDVSKGGTEKPKGVEVTPPPTPPSMAEGSPSGAGTPPGGGTPPPEGNGGGDPGAEVRRRMEELLEQAGQTGAAIPRALEELVRMIPRSKSKSKPDGSPRRIRRLASRVRSPNPASRIRRTRKRAIRRTRTATPSRRRATSRLRTARRAIRRATTPRPGWPSCRPRPDAASSTPIRSASRPSTGN